MKVWAEATVKYGTKMDIWAEVTVKIWYTNGGMGGSYGKNMELEWRYRPKLRWLINYSV
jgi:hypothetical protein